MNCIQGSEGFSGMTVQLAQLVHSWVMADQVQAWRAWFWDADFWLPDNTTWQRLDETKNTKWLQSGELFLCFPVAILLIVLRFVFERLVVKLICDLFVTCGEYSGF